MRKHDRQRLAEQDLRRNILQNKLAMMADAGSHRDVIINLSKHDSQGIINVNDRIARRIKSHQLEGVRFMWNQVVTNEAKQGCLLAHTMGLGKTMQVITLLVAIAESSASTDESVYSQIPEHLRASRTLILCPPGLRDNWIDELLTWAPPKVLGDLRKVDQRASFTDRIRTISDW